MKNTNASQMAHRFVSAIVDGIPCIYAAIVLGLSDLQTVEMGSRSARPTTLNILLLRIEPCKHRPV
jgi:hypothetical protein